MSEDEKAIIKYSENYILSLKDLNIFKRKKLLNEFIENHINLMNNTIEKIKIENNIIIDNLNIDFSNLDDNIILTTEDLNYENNSREKNLENLISDSDSKKELTESSKNSVLKKTENEDQVKICEEDIILSNNTSLFNTPKNNNNEIYNIKSLSDIDKNKNKKTPLLKSANPYFPSNLKINKVNKENKNKTEIIKEKNIKEVNLENKNNIKENIKKNEDKLFKTPISISSNNDYTYSN